MEWCKGSRYWKTLVVMGGILFLSFTPGKAFQDAPSFAGADWVIHAGMYAVLSLTMIWERFDQIGPLRNRVFITMSFWVLLIGGVTEWVQSLWIPGRSGDPMDLLADYVGFLIVYGIWKARIGRNSADGHPHL